MQDEQQNDGSDGFVERRKEQAASLHQHLGRLEGRMDGIEERQSRFEIRTDSSLNRMDGKLDQLLSASVQNSSDRKADWRMVTAAGSIIVFLVSIIGWGINRYLELKDDVYPIRTHDDISQQIEEETDDEDSK